MTDLFDHPALQQPSPRSAARERSAAKKRRQRQRRVRTAIVTVVVLALVGGAGWFTWGQVAGSFHNPFSHQAEDYPGPGGAAVQVEIPEGSTGGDMATALLAADVVASRQAFLDAFKENPGATGIQPGTYSLQEKMKATDAVAALVKNLKVETKVTIPEGFTAAQVLDRISSVTSITKADLDAAIKDPGSIGLPAEAGGKVEGWLFPATYVVQPKDTAVTLLKSMIGKTVAELDKAGVPADQRYDILKEASIVEREAPADYFGQVARAIVNRLNSCDGNGGRLGMDAIDGYGLNKPTNQITDAEFHDAKLPYASRVHPGLPPTPIGNPGAKAIEAAVNPPAGTECWYVTVNLDTGETKFTDNFNEFNQYRSEFKAWEAKNG